MDNQSEQAFLREYELFKENYEKTYAYLIDRFGSMKEAEKYADQAYVTAAFYTFLHGRYLPAAVYHLRHIPQSKAKAFSRVSKAFDVIRRPRNATTWFVKNIKSLQTLLESASWPSSSAESERVEHVDGFTILNHTRASDLSANIKMLEASKDLMLKSSIPRIADVIYGEIHFVEPFTKDKRVAAIYKTDVDTIFVVVTERFESSMIKSMIHEFGHRYYKKIWTRERHLAWAGHHRDVLRSIDDVPMPRIGERISVIKGAPAVIGYGSDGRGAPTLMFGPREFVTLAKYRSVMRTNAAKRALPTPYSATNSEEHFCDSLAMYCLGTLEEPHRSNFEAIVMERRSIASNPRAAARRLASGSCR